MSQEKTRKPKEVSNRPMGKSNTKINVVYCVTSDYLEKIKPSIRSLRAFNDVNIYVVTETNETDIEDVTLINVANQQYFPKDSVNYNNMFTHIGLLKVCYQSLLPIDKVIHLDADTIINGSLKPMWDIDLTNKWYAMVPEYKGRYKPFGDKYYNAGVMLINLKGLRESNIENEMIFYLNSFKQPWCEQDAFNKFGIENNKIVDLDIKYNENVMTGYTDEPVVIHYCSIGNWWNNPTMSRVEYLNRYR